MRVSAKLATFMLALLCSEGAAFADWDDAALPNSNAATNQSAAQSAPASQSFGSASSAPTFAAKQAQSTTPTYAQPIRKQQFDVQDYLTTPTVLPETGRFGGGAANPMMQTAAPRAVFQPPPDQFFGGFKAPADLSQLPPIRERYNPGKSPEWVKDRLQRQDFEDGTEHFGNLDPLGFTH